MCLSPIMLLNPTLKKIEETGEIDIKKLRRYRGFKTRCLAVDKNKGVCFESENNNCTDMDIYSNKDFLRSSYKGYYLPTYIKVPCGKCYECVKQKTNQMVARMYLEQKKHSDFGFFVTLTYDEVNCPHVVCENGDILPTLNKKDVQDFLKRLRINMSRKGVDVSDFKYFYVGEYGMKNTDNKRPHYHMCVFFDVLPVNEFYDFVALNWRNGNIKVDILNDKRLRYCANSHATANKLFPTPKGVVKPFSNWSKGFGIPSRSDEKYIRNNMRVSIGEMQYPVDSYLKSKCFSQEELNDRRKYQADLPMYDDRYKKFLKFMYKFYPRIRDVSELTPEMFSKIENAVKEHDKVKSEQFYKKYVLKRY